MASAHPGRLGPVELLEESLQLLRAGGRPILLCYWTGALPFAISLLWLLRDTGFSWGQSLLLKDTFFCAAAFLWMTYWKSLASQKTLLLLNQDSAPSAPRFTRLARQSAFQTAKLFALPLAVCSLVAWPAASTFFRTLAIEPSSPRRAFAAATHRVPQIAVAFLITAAFAVIGFVNLLVTIALLPTLWKMLTGYETDWSRMANPAAIAGLFYVAAIATWLLLDPWLQTCAILRLFYQDARSDGRDLLRDIARLAILLLVLTTIPAKAAQQQTGQRQNLDQSIQNASQDIHYGWLHTAAAAPPSGFLHDLYVSARDHIRTWYRAASTWLRDLFSNRKEIADDARKSKPRSQELRWTLALLAVMVCGLIIALFLRTGKIQTIKTQSASAAAPDILNENLLPTEVKQEDWLRLASGYLEKNQIRLAARAFYLANLSYLGTQNLLSLSLYKSNRLYERELTRQPKSAALTPAFLATNRLYETAWYGLRELHPDQIQILQSSTLPPNAN